MSVHIVTGVRSAMPPTAATRPSADASAARHDLASPASPASPAARADAPAQPEAPPRFPWLSRLTARLEPVSRQPSPYGTAPLLGEHVDRQA